MLVGLMLAAGTSATVVALKPSDEDQVMNTLRAFASATTGEEACGYLHPILRRQTARLSTDGTCAGVYERLAKPAADFTVASVEVKDGRARAVTTTRSEGSRIGAYSFRAENRLVKAGDTWLIIEIG